MPSYFEMVKDFHTAYGATVNNSPQGGFPDLQLRLELHREEYEELLHAIGERDLVEAADAIGDLIYVLCGSAVAWGIPLDDVFAEIHASNMSKLMPDGSVRRREDGKVLPGPNFRLPDLRRVIYSEAS